MQREERCKLNTMYFSWSEALDSRRSPQFLLSPCKGKFMVGYNFVITLRVSSLYGLLLVVSIVISTESIFAGTLIIFCVLAIVITDC